MVGFLETEAEAMLVIVLFGMLFLFLITADYLANYYGSEEGWVIATAKWLPYWILISTVIAIFSAYRISERKAKKSKR